jgi:hypothetical protein
MFGRLKDWRRIATRYTGAPRLSSLAMAAQAHAKSTEVAIRPRLRQARKAGFTIDEVIADQGQSGVSTILSERPEGRRLFDKLRRGDTLWDSCGPVPLHADCSHVTRRVDDIGRQRSRGCIFWPLSPVTVMGDA